NVVRWTGDLLFLRQQIGRMRAAVDLLDRAFYGAQLGYTRVTWTGHDGLRGWVRDEQGRLTAHPESGIGGNYFDLLPFGYDDAWLTAQYLGALEALAEIEALAEAYPGLGLLEDQRPGSSKLLSDRARKVRERGGAYLFDPGPGRFVACIDAGGVPHDYGYTFLNLDAVRFGLANALQREQILSWLFAEREVEGDTSVGPDLYHWRFGLRTSSVRNVEWYSPVWTDPASQPFGGQIQDGGAVLGFTYFELMERLRWRGVDDAFERYREVLGWYREVEGAGGFRPYYASPRREGTLQGCGTPGGLGLDCEFQEGRLIAAFAAHGLLGLQPDLQRLAIRPRFPRGCARIGLEGLQYRGVRLDIAARPDRVDLTLHDLPLGPLTFALDGQWELDPGRARGSQFTVERPGDYVLRRVE
ncbi:MAG: glycosyl hydrolase family 65 protein, partial [Planctomycetota bacterium]